MIKIIPAIKEQKTLDSSILLEGLTQCVGVFNQNLILQNWNLNFSNCFSVITKSHDQDIFLKDILLDGFDLTKIEDDNAIAFSIVREIIKADHISEIFSFNFEYAKFDGKYYSISGKVIDGFGLIITVTDITGRKKADMFQRSSNNILANHMLNIDDDSQIMEQQATDAICMAEELAIAREEFEQSAIHMQAILNAMAEGLVTINEDGEIQTVNKAITEIFNYELADIENKEILTLFKSSQFLSTKDLLHHVKKMECPEYKIKETAVKKDKTEFPIELSISEIFSTKKREFTVIFRDITEQEEAEKRIRKMALEDSLTGLANRNLLKKSLDNSLKNARRHGNPLAVMFLDLDMFKPVNDLYGHGVGDELLKVVAARLEDAARETDIVARLGGDEFSIICTNLENERSVLTIAERILGSIQEPVQINNKILQIGTSIGISFYPADSEDPEELFRMADVALYKAKEDGRRTYKLYNSEMDSSAKLEKQIATQLAQAIDNEELLLYYQPQIDAKTLEVVGVEALIRWLHPERGMIPPNSFISIAESTGLIHSIGQWVLDTACVQMKKWHDQGYLFKICVNISARQFHSQDFIASIRDSLKISNLDPKYIELEITESTVIQDIETMIEKLEEISNIGISLAIDDFGTGYSSLAYLKRFPVDQLKIDQSFIREIIENHEDAAITDAVIHLGHSIGLNVVAEGVETPQQVKLLQEKGCDLLQGYYFSTPLDDKEFINWVNDYDPKII